jgi:hypothetical protein
LAVVQKVGCFDAHSYQREICRPLLERVRFPVEPSRDGNAMFDLLIAAL